MSEQPDFDVEAALRAALEFDPGESGVDPERLERLLRDVLPFDDRVVELLLLGARIGVPVLVSSGRSRDALHLLATDIGLRPEVALWVVERWSAGLGASPPPRDTPAP